MFEQYDCRTVSGHDGYGARVSVTTPDTRINCRETAMPPCLCPNEGRYGFVSGSEVGHGWEAAAASYGRGGGPAKCESPVLSSSCSRNARPLPSTAACLARTDAAPPPPTLPSLQHQRPPNAGSSFTQGLFVTLMKSLLLIPLAWGLAQAATQFDDVSFSLSSRQTLSFSHVSLGLLGVLGSTGFNGPVICHIFLRW